VKKMVIIGSAVVILAALGILLGATMALGHNLWDTCNKVNGLCYYPGLCRSYVDTNGDNICDRSQPYPSPIAAVTESPETMPPLVLQDDNRDDSADDMPAENGEFMAGIESSAPASPSLSRYFLLPVLVITSLLYLVTWVLSNRKVISIKLHRRIWNVVLLIVLVVSGLLGIYLILEIDFNVHLALPIDPLFWHVEAGIAMAMVAVFHIAWHWRYFQKMLSTAKTET